MKNTRTFPEGKLAAIVAGSLALLAIGVSGIAAVAIWL